MISQEKIFKWFFVNNICILSTEIDKIQNVVTKPVRMIWYNFENRNSKDVSDYLSWNWKGVWMDDDRCQNLTWPLGTSELNKNFTTKGHNQTQPVYLFQHHCVKTSERLAMGNPLFTIFQLIKGHNSRSIKDIRVKNQTLSKTCFNKMCLTRIFICSLQKIKPYLKHVLIKKIGWLIFVCSLQKDVNLLSQRMARLSSNLLRQTLQNFLLKWLGSDQQCATGFWN